ncbi:DMT family transporter [Pontibacterium granulatum]|uniref:DMT family transporter n=1 Tax=Pontibacterium granulatum TaxID=2036029 RepID=UPI002499C799|nr:DMT family transporter [Pontibacterium granulatum]MDI3323729.1 DMT family transporter [Pontibacterium granulatum]
MGTRQPLDLFAIGTMTIFCMVMASQQVMLKAVAEDLAPVFQIALRSGIAAALLIGLILVQRHRMPLAPENRIPALLIGVLFTLEFLLVGEALNKTSAGHATVFLYTSPIFAAIGLHLKIPNERMSRLQWLGILLAFVGIVLAFLGGDSTATLSRDVLWGDFLALLAGAAWGLTTVVVRATGLSALPARQTLLYQLVVAFVLLSLWAYMTGQADVNPTPEAMGSLAFHGIVVSFIAFLVWFWLLTKYKASQLGILSFMTPVFGVLLGNWLLSERIEANFIIGSGLIIGGILLVSSHGWLSKRRERRAGKPA